ncbi:MAG: lipopolysaccharide heptosyltransferase II [Gammaproteobacteria bacterium]|jgi:heptosyltransferase-2|nr:lipopolysaccharide heptosyltransferase II [Gammaproteobacteria bacterium]
MTSTERILIIGPSWIGDMVMAQALFMSLRQERPQCHITVMAPDWTRPLLARMPEVDESIDAQLGHGELRLVRRLAIGRPLQAIGFTTAIVLPNSFKSALIPFHAGIPRRIGWGGEWRAPLLTDCRRLNKANYPLMVQRFVALAFPACAQPPAVIPNPVLEIDAINASKTLLEFDLHDGAKILGICPGAEFGEAKQWPAQHFAAMCNAVLTDDWQVWIFGSNNDALVAEAILADIETDKIDRCINLTGKTNLAQAIDLMSVTTVVVSNDTGLMHIAAALGKPVAGLYGSTSPDFTPPLTESVKLLATDIECRPCFKRTCPYGHQRCLTELQPARVLEAISQLIEA